MVSHHRCSPYMSSEKSTRLSRLWGKGKGQEGSSSSHANLCAVHLQNKRVTSLCSCHSWFHCILSSLSQQDEHVGDALLSLSLTWYNWYTISALPGEVVGVLFQCRKPQILEPGTQYCLYGSYLSGLLPPSTPSWLSTLTWDHDSELHIKSPFMPSSANKTHVEIHWQAASMTLNSKYKSLLLPLSLSFSLLLSWQALSQLSSRHLSCIYEGRRDNTPSSCLQGFSWVSLVCCSISPSLCCLEYTGKETSEGD